MIVKRISAEQTHLIRKIVLRENIPLPYEFQGDYDSTTLHLGAFLKEELVAVASFMKVQLEGFEGVHFQLRGMATLKAHQGGGFGRALLKKAEEALKKLDCDLIWCNARIAALSFYQKNGYEIIGEVFDIDLIGPHYKMLKKI